MRKGGPESEFRPQIQLKDSEIFLGLDGIAFTPYGATIQKILLHVHTLQIVKKSNIAGKSFGESRLKSIKQELSSLCRENGVPNDPVVMQELETQLRRLTEARMDSPKRLFFGKNGVDGNKHS